MNHKYINTFV